MPPRPARPPKAAVAPPAAVVDSFAAAPVAAVAAAAPTANAQPPFSSASSSSSGVVPSFPHWRSDLSRQAEEIEVLRSIYPPEDELRVLVEPASADSAPPSSAAAPPPASARLELSLGAGLTATFTLPLDYPSTRPPQCELQFSSAWNGSPLLSEGDDGVESLQSELLAELYDLSSAPLEREAVVFQWASALRERLVEPEEARRTLVKEEQERMDAVHARQMELEALALEEEKEQAVSLFDDAEGDAQHGSMTSWSQHSAAAAAAATSAPPIPIISGLPVTDRRSTFQAHAARVTSLADVATVLSQLRAIPKIARATHPAMYAAAIGGGGGDAGSSSSVVLRRCDDCGESGAGGRLEYLLLRMEVRDMIVVVTRWYGGIQLGGDRWKHINAVARDVVEKLREQQQAAETSSAAASGGSKKADKKAAAAANKAHKR